MASTTTSGLTRRRGAGGGGGAGDDAAGNGDSSNGAVNRSSTSNARDSAPETSYESGENGHKIAFDPRDISESAERSKQPKLTLMEEVLLLGLKDKQVGCPIAVSIDPRRSDGRVSCAVFLSLSARR
jgi:golgi phosphoprotein 3